MPLFKNLNVVIIDDMITLENTKLLYRVEYGLISSTIIRKFKRASHNYNTRDVKYNVPKHTERISRLEFLRYRI